MIKSKIKMSDDKSEELEERRRRVVWEKEKRTKPNQKPNHGCGVYAENNVR